jgi:hypothetical protein
MFYCIDLHPYSHYRFSKILRPFCVSRNWLMIVVFLQSNISSPPTQFAVFPQCTEPRIVLFCFLQNPGVSGSGLSSNTIVLFHPRPCPCCPCPRRCCPCRHCPCPRCPRCHPPRPCRRPPRPRRHPPVTLLGVPWYLYRYLPTCLLFIKVLPLPTQR